MSKGWKIAGCVAFGALIVIVLGWVTMLLWNWLVPVLFAGPFINLWQALGLILLSKILFHGLGKGHWQGKNQHNHAWKGRIYEKFSNMTPEERESFKQKMKNKWCQYDSQKSQENISTNSND